MRETSMPEAADTENEQGSSFLRKFRQLFKSSMPWIVTIILLGYVFIYKVDFFDVLNAVRLVKLGIFIPIVLIVFVIGILSSTLAYYLAFNWLATKVGFKEIFYARGAIHILSIINYALEQGGLGYWLARKKDVSSGQAVSTIFFIMFIGGFMIMVLSTVGLLLTPDVNIDHFIVDGPGTRLLRITLIYIAISIIAMVIWTTKPKTGFLGFLFRGPFQVFDKLKLRHFIYMFLLNLIPFISYIIGAWMGLKAFGVTVPFVRVLSYIPLIEFIAAIPISVMGLGTTQVAWIKFFDGLVSPEIIVAFSMLWFVFAIILRLILGLCCLPAALGDFRKKKGRIKN